MERNLCSTIRHIVCAMTETLERQQLLIERSELMLKDAGRRLGRIGRIVQPNADPPGTGKIPGVRA
jgi:hypothetical protein